MSNWFNELEFAKTAAVEAGNVTLGYFQQGVAVETKGDNSPVTEADRNAENLLRNMIADRFPGDGIVGEEFGEHVGTTGRRWILDPIDGTISFVRGVPLYGVLVALEADGMPVVGVAHMPPLGETVSAARGLGCHWNERQATVSEIDTVKKATVLYTDTRDFAKRAEGTSANELIENAGVVRGWGDCYGHLLVATGRAEVMIDPYMHVWDCAALAPIVEEAGGSFTDWNGESTITGGNAVSTNGRLYGEVVRRLSR